MLKMICKLEYLKFENVAEFQSLLSIFCWLAVVESDASGFLPCASWALSFLSVNTGKSFVCLMQWPFESSGAANVLKCLFWSRFLCFLQIALAPVQDNLAADIYIELELEGQTDMNGWGLSIFDFTYYSNLSVAVKDFFEAQPPGMASFPFL